MVTPSRTHDLADQRVVASVYLTTTSTAMADDRTWERIYCTDKYYKAPSEEDRARLQVSLQKLHSTGNCYKLSSVVPVLIPSKPEAIHHPTRPTLQSPAKTLQQLGL